MATPAEIKTWAAGIQLPECLGVEFNAQFGRLPQSLQEFTSWGDSTGRRDASGGWSCKGVTPGTGTTPIPPGTPTPPGSLTAFLQANPVIALGGAALVLVLLLKK